MQEELITAIIALAGSVFSIDRLITLVKALRQPNDGRTACALEHEHGKALLERLVDSQNTMADILRELAAGQSVLLDRKPTSDRPRTLELINAYDRERRRPLITDPPKER